MDNLMLPLPINHLLEPISEELPTGIPLESSPLAWEVRDALKQAQASKGTQNDWDRLRLLCESGLQEVTKDATLAAHWTRAKTALEGFSGLSDGLELIRELMVLFWQDLHPAPTFNERGEPDYEEAWWALIQLNGNTMEQMLLTTPLVDSDTFQMGLWYFQQPSRVSYTLSSNEETLATLHAPTREEFQTTVLSADPASLRDQLSVIEKSQKTIEDIYEILAERINKLPLSFSRLNAVLDAAAKCLTGIAGPLLETDISQEVTTSEQDEVGLGNPRSVNRTDNRSFGPIQTRKDAFRMLEQIAIFFESTEPQSILPSLIRRTIKWGKMPPAELLQELIDDSTTRDQIYRLTGIEAMQESD